MSFRQLAADIKNNDIKRVYLICGSETYLIDKGWESLRNAVVTVFPELNYTLLEGEQIRASEVTAACETFPFGTERRLVAVRDLKLLKSTRTEGEEAAAPAGEVQSFIDAVNSVPDTACLIFVCYGSVDKRKKLVGEIKKYGAVYEFDRVEKEELAAWIRKHLGKNGKKIAPKELDYFINSAGYLDKNGNKTLYDVENMLNKLENFMGNAENVAMEHIEAVLPRNIENDIWKLINACSEKDVDRSLRVYNDLLLEGESSMGILALLSKQIKNMIEVSELHERKFDGKSIAEKLKIHEYTVKLCIRYSGAIKRGALCSAFHKCVEAELNVKSGRMGERLAMELLFASLFE